MELKRKLQFIDDSSEDDLSEDEPQFLTKDDQILYYKSKI
jgi:hypothetical protein